jgi:Ca-activated chloride channel homolog
VRLLTPAGLVAAAAALPLVLWYLLRPRRRRVVVASTFLWRAVDRPATASTPWQRFRGDITFWLVLVALLALAVALARPAVEVPVALGDHTILIVDAAGSMLADEDGVSRAELARREATELTAGLAPGQEVSVIEAGPRARIALAGSTDAREVARALSRIAPRQAPSDLADAFTLATSLQRPGQTTVLHLLTDGVVPADAQPLAPPGLTVRAVGSDRPNVALTRLVATPIGSGEHQVLAQVTSYAASAVRGRVVLAIDDTPVVEQPIRLAPRTTEDLVLTVPTTGDERARLSATLILEPDVTGELPDALPFDDVATTVLAEARDLEVLVAGPGNTFLEAALDAVPGVALTTAAAVPEDLSGIDVLVVDRVGAPPAPSVPTLLVAPTAWPEGVEVAGTSELPPLTFQSTDHPLLADVDLTGLAVSETARIEAPALTVLAAGPDAPLLLAGRLGEAPTIAVPFDLTASDLPLRPAWPLLIANATSWLTGGGTGTVAVPSGSTVSLPAPAGTTVVTAHPPSDGDGRRIDPAAPSVLVDEVGLWRITFGGVEGPESELVLPVTTAPGLGDLSRPRPDPTASRAVDAEGETTETTGVRAVAWPLVLLALVLAIGEWVWTHGLRHRWHIRSRRRSPRAPPHGFVAATPPTDPASGAGPEAGAGPEEAPVEPPVAASPRPAGLPVGVSADAPRSGSGPSHPPPSGGGR